MNHSVDSEAGPFCRHDVRFDSVIFGASTMLPYCALKSSPETGIASSLRTKPRFSVEIPEKRTKLIPFLLSNRKSC